MQMHRLFLYKHKIFLFKHTKTLKNIDKHILTCYNRDILKQEVK